MSLFETLAEGAGQPFVPLNTGGSGELRLTAQGPTEVLTMSLQERGRVAKRVVRPRVPTTE